MQIAQHIQHFATTFPKCIFSYFYLNRSIEKINLEANHTFPLHVKFFMSNTELVNQNS